NLDLSVQKGLWATQKHNEGILDQAFRTSKEVYIIFGVNKSGEFYGYARVESILVEGIGGERKDETWGESFKVEWICTERLPFYRIQHIRNSWNHDKEIKVSRDGTELEPSVGQQLIDEWAKLAVEANQQPGTMAASS
ncbi:YTH-domain-containing protein, partial [Dendrothele bispora CBS 962.96]